MRGDLALGKPTVRPAPPLCGLFGIERETVSPDQFRLQHISAGLEADDHPGLLIGADAYIGHVPAMEWVGSIEGHTPPLPATNTQQRLLWYSWVEVRRLHAGEDADSAAKRPADWAHWRGTWPVPNELAVTLPARATSPSEYAHTTTVDAPSLSPRERARLRKLESLGVQLPPDQHKALHASTIARSPELRDVSEARLVELVDRASASAGSLLYDTYGRAEASRRARAMLRAQSQYSTSRMRHVDPWRRSWAEPALSVPDDTQAEVEKDKMQGLWTRADGRGKPLGLLWVPAAFRNFHTWPDRYGHLVEAIDTLLNTYGDKWTAVVAAKQDLSDKLVRMDAAEKDYKEERDEDQKAVKRTALYAVQEEHNDAAATLRDAIQAARAAVAGAKLGWMLINEGSAPSIEWIRSEKQRLVNGTHPMSARNRSRWSMTHEQLMADLRGPVLRAINAAHDAVSAMTGTLATYERETTQVHAHLSQLNVGTLHWSQLGFTPVKQPL